MTCNPVDTCIPEILNLLCTSDLHHNEYTIFVVLICGCTSAYWLWQDRLHIRMCLGTSLGHVSEFT